MDLVKSLDGVKINMVFRGNSWSRNSLIEAGLITTANIGYRNNVYM